jgi:hypothetical protein
MFGRSLVAGGVREWERLLRQIDAKPSILSQRETNQILDELARAIDDESEVRALKLDTDTAKPQPTVRPYHWRKR